MSYFHRLDEPLEESEPQQRQDKSSAGSRFAEFGERIARAFANVDRGRVDRPALEPGELGPEERFDDGAGPDLAPPRFAVGPFGYNRAAVDEYISDLERELDELRHERPAPVSINEELERIGEQTASILVVAHDQAHETTRRAEELARETTSRAREQAERCIADAAANAVQITEQAKRRLHELDNETDAVWRERIRLLEDARSTGGALVGLADEAAERFPEDTKTVTAVQVEPTDAPARYEDTELEPVDRFEDTQTMEPVRFDE